jgi:cellulose synthase/poly-beta-1,6-N-acetylglucosamine synthase-like glycosyltransferase
MWFIYVFFILCFALYHLRAWQRLRPLEYKSEALPSVKTSPHISFLVPAWNAAGDIESFVTAFKTLTYPNKELILCAGGDDKSLEKARALAAHSVVVLEQQRGMGKQKALQRCYEASRGELIYLTDIDCRVDDQSFNRVTAPVLAGREQIVTGSSKPAFEQQRIGAVLIHWALVRKAEGVTGSYVTGLLGRNCVVTREALESVGGFSFAAPTGTDYRLAQELRARGYKIWREPESEISTEYAWPLKSYIRKRARWVRNVLLFGRKQRGEFFNALSVVIIPAAMVTAALLSLLLSFWLPLSFALLPFFMALLVFLHGTINRLRYVRETLGKHHLSFKTFAGAVLNCYGQLAAGLYALYTTLVPRLRKQW